MKKSKDPKFLRLQMIKYAMKYGISAAAKAFKVTRKTVYKWLSRHEERGYAGLESLSRRPKHSPAETPADIKKQVIAAKKKYKNLGAEQVKVLENLSPCPDTIRKIWRKAGMKPRNRVKKHITKNNLRAEKRKWELFQQIDIDVKYLDDIPNYYIPMKKHKLPIYQYTARDVTSGCVFWCFAYEKTLTNAVIFLRHLINHLKIHKVDISKISIQTDNGAEFIGAYNAKSISEFTKTIEAFGMQHFTIPPGAHRFQSDVETFHNIEEVEFFDIEKFNNLTSMLDKTYTYQLFFNLIRPNTYKENQTPWNIVQKKNPKLLKTVCMLRPAILDKMVYSGYTRSVYDVYLNPSNFFLFLCI